MVNRLESLCEYCRFGKIEISEGYKVTKFRKIEKCTRLSYLCLYSYQNKPKFIGIKDCPHFKPKAGKIGKKLYQKTLTEN